MAGLDLLDVGERRPEVEVDAADVVAGLGEGQGGRLAHPGRARRGSAPSARGRRSCRRASRSGRGGSGPPESSSGSDADDPVACRSARPGRSRYSGSRRLSARRSGEGARGPWRRCSRRVGGRGASASAGFDDASSSATIVRRCECSIDQSTMGVGGRWPARRGTASVSSCCGAGDERARDRVDRRLTARRYPAAESPCPATNAPTHAWTHDDAQTTPVSRSRSISSRL